MIEDTPHHFANFLLFFVRQKGMAEDEEFDRGSMGWSMPLDRLGGGGGDALRAAGHDQMRLQYGPMMGLNAVLALGGAGTTTEPDGTPTEA